MAFTHAEAYQEGFWLCCRLSGSVYLEVTTQYTPEAFATNAKFPTIGPRVVLGAQKTARNADPEANLQILSPPALVPKLRGQFSQKHEMKSNHADRESDWVAMI
jgi:hypothetical protein